MSELSFSSNRTKASSSVQTRQLQREHWAPCLLCLVIPGRPLCSLTQTNLCSYSKETGPQTSNRRTMKEPWWSVRHLLCSTSLITWHEIWGELMMARYWKMLLAKVTVHIDTGRCLPEGSFDIYHNKWFRDCENSLKSHSWKIRLPLYCSKSQLNLIILFPEHFFLAIFTYMCIWTQK